MTPKKLSRKQFLMLAGSGMTAAALAACAQPTPAPAPAAPAKAEPAKAPAAAEPTKAPAAKAPVTVEYLGWGDQADVPAWDKISKDYMAKNTNVTVKVTTVADPGNNHYPKLQTMIAGGTPPDIASFQGWEWQVYADKGVLTPIDELVGTGALKGLYPNLPAIETTTKRKGKLYLVPMEIATMVMFYAKKPFQDAGIPFPTDEWTFEQFLETAKKLTKTDGANKLFGYQANGSWFRDIGWIVGAGKREFDNVIDPKKAQFNQPEIVNLIQTVAYDVYHTLKIAPTPADMSGGANTIQTGNCAMKYEGAWFFPQLNSAALRDQKKNVEFDIVRMPIGADKARPHRNLVSGVALPKGKNTEAAWAFTSYLGSEEGVKTYSEVTGRIPSYISLAETWWSPTIEKNFGVKNGKALIEAFKNSQVDVVGGVPRAKMWSEVVKPTAWDPMVNGSAKAADVLPKADAGLQKLLDEYWATQK